MMTQKNLYWTGLGIGLALATVLIIIFSDKDELGSKWTEAAPAEAPKAEEKKA